MEEQTTIQLDAVGQKAIANTGKWALFFAILGFIAVGMMVIGGIFFAITFAFAGASFDSEFPMSGFGGLFGILMGLVYLVFAAIYFFPIYKLFRFSQLIEKAIKAKNSTMLTDALVELNNHYKWLGYYTIGAFALYILGVMFVMVMGGMGAMVA